MKRFLSLIGALCLILSSIPAAVSADTSQTLDFTQMHGYYQPLGRTVEHNNCLYMDNVAAGFEMYFYGSGDVILNATVRCSSDYENAQYLAVYVDGTLTRMRIECEELNTNYAKSLTLASGLSEGYHHIEVYRQTEAKISLFRAETVTFTGRLLATPPAKDLTIDVIGDSISAGYGCLWNSSLGVSDPGGNHPAYEDGTQSYAFLAGKTLGANVRVTQTSGYGCVAGWNGTYPNLQDMYPYACWWRSTEYLYNFNPPADVVVINLGTNDYNTRTANDLTNEEFKAGALNLMKMAKEYNNGAPVVWCTGMMGTFYQAEIEAAVEELGGAQAGYYFLLLPQGMSGAVSHPTAAQQAAAGETLADFLLETILPDDYTATASTAVALQAAIDSAKAVASPSAALTGAIERAEMELAVGTTDPYRLGARKNAIDKALDGSVTALNLLPSDGITEAPIAADGVSYIWTYYENDDGSVTMYKAGEGQYWPQLTTSYIQTVDIDETPYLTMEFAGTASFNLNISYRAADGSLYSVNASSLAGISQTDFPARSKGTVTVDFGTYIRNLDHATEEGLVSILSCNLFVIGQPDQYVRLYTCGFTDDSGAPTAISGSYTVTDGILSGVTQGLTVDELIAAMDNSNYLTVKNADGTDADGVLATGMTLCLIADGNTVDTAVVAVRGDVNGDGAVSSSDARAALTAMLHNSDTLSGAIFIASDFNGDNSITTTDVRLMLKASVS